MPTPEMPSCRPPAVIVKFDVLRSSVFVEACPPPGMSPTMIAFDAMIEPPSVNVADPESASNETVDVLNSIPPLPQLPPQNVIVTLLVLVNAIGAAKDQLADVERFVQDPETVQEPEDVDVMYCVEKVIETDPTVT